MKKFLGFIFSNKLTLVALIAFAFSMAYATFIENDFGTPVARRGVYDSWWFEVIMLILVLNFAGNIYRYQLLRKEKLGILVFHLAFIVTLIGAFITRYSGQEGLVRIREGESTNRIISQERFFNLQLAKDAKSWSMQKEVSLTQFHQPNISFEYTEEDPIAIRVNRFVPNAVQGLVEGTEGQEVIELVSSTSGSRIGYYLGMNRSVFINGYELTYNNPKKDAINIVKEGSQYLIDAPQDFNYVVMATQESGRLFENRRDTLKQRALYQSESLNFVISQIHQNTSLDFTTTDDKDKAQNAADLLFVDVDYQNEVQQIILAALDGVYSPTQNFQFGEYQLGVSYGPKIIEMPFSLKLEDFQLERYPGSVSPSSYASEIVVQDEASSFPVRISMNNVLDHRGYRFFQASYDLDELGTVLSVNRDYWGTLVTYLGYTLMGIGMFLTLFSKHSRFSVISKKLAKLQNKKQASLATVVLLLLFSGTLNAQIQAINSPDIISSTYIDEQHAEEFGKLMVQDMDGRIKPVNTLSSEFLRKLTRKTSYAMDDGQGSTVKLNPDQVFLSIHQNPQIWQNLPLIKVDEDKGKFMLEQLGLSGKELISFNDLIADNGAYLLNEDVQFIQRKKPAARSESEKELIKVDERFNILFQALSGNYLKIFPQPTAEDNKWFNNQFLNAGFSSEDSVFVRNILPVYYADLQAGQLKGDMTAANDKLNYIKTFQAEMGKEIIPPSNRVEAELIYNRLNIFNRLFPIYWMLGVYLITLAVLKVFFQSSLLNKAYGVGVGLTAAASVALTANMILRWYAGGYPPWSNGYEMIILVAWALFLFGFIFYKKSDFVLPLVALFGGTLLFVSFLDWLNPEITNLVPVLKSYWLKIHVAIIVSSYAPLALSALLGLLSLVFMGWNESKFKPNIKELTYINELSMTIGLFLLSIGTFLGGIWANESWGRYWGWDPKETWALISIIIYATVLHLRFIPKLKGAYTFNLASVIAFFSIIMTSFGVNYYLSGLHSYAAGDPLPIPTFVYWVIGLIIAVGIFAFMRSSDDMKLKEA